MGDKYLSDIIKYDEDIKKHNFIAIYSGVGSGKSRYINSFCRKDPKIDNPQMTVLIITSRRAKVDEILEEQMEKNEKDKAQLEFLDEEDVEGYIKGKIGHWGNVHRKEEETVEEFREKNKQYRREIEKDGKKYFVYQKSAVCTNAFIEKYIQNVYDSHDVTTHLWELFDMIVVDEVHSLILDASYQTAPFYVNDLIKEYLWRCKEAGDDYHLLPKCKHLIIMTGTPEHLKDLEVVWKHNLHVIDKREECINVMPKNIYFIKKRAVKKQLQKHLKDGERTIYFAPSITRIKSIYSKLGLEDMSIVAQSFSKAEEREAVSDEIRGIMEATEERIKKEGLLPDTIQLLLSTERLKEGINIKNKDITNIYVESKHMGDIVQMAGRVRAGAENMYVVLDGGRDKEDVLKSLEARFSFNKLVGTTPNKKALTDFWEKLCWENDSDLFNNRDAVATVHDAGWSEKFIEFVHEKFEYIRFSYFRNCFDFYANKYWGEWEYGSSDLKWYGAMDNGKMKTLFEKSFPKSKVHPCKVTVNKQKEITADMVEEAKKYIDEHLTLGMKYSLNECEEFRGQLNKILSTNYDNFYHIFNCLNMKRRIYPVSDSGKEYKKKIVDKDKKMFLYVIKD